MVWNLVSAEHVSTIVVVGDVMGRPLIEALQSHSDYDTSSLSVIVSSGASLTETTRDGLLGLIPKVRIINRLGSTESGTIGVASDTVERRSGKPKFTASGDTAVLDESLVPLIPGSSTVGKLARTGYIPLGYHRDPETTASTFVVDSKGTRWVLPGDSARVLEDGSIELLGRGSTTINSGGKKIYPYEVEAALKAHSSVSGAIVVGVSDARFGEKVAAIVQTTTSGSAADSDELIRHCRTLIAGYKVPRLLVSVDQIPLTAVGKPDHLAARKILEASNTLKPVANNRATS